MIQLSTKFLGVHVITLSAITVCFIVTYRRLMMHPIHRVAIAGIVTMLGVCFYDLVWLIGANNELINWLRLGETLLMLMFLIFYNYYFDFYFIKINRYFIGVLIFYFISMLGLGISGWFKFFKAWAVDQTLPDPHSWMVVWVGKITGLLMWTFVIKPIEVSE